MLTLKDAPSLITPPGTLKETVDVAKSRGSTLESKSANAVISVPLPVIFILAKDRGLEIPGPESEMPEIAKEAGFKPVKLKRTSALVNGSSSGGLKKPVKPPWFETLSGFAGLKMIAEWALAMERIAAAVRARSFFIDSGKLALATK